MSTRNKSTIAYVLTIESVEERLIDAKDLINSLKSIKSLQEVSLIPAIYWKEPQKIVDFVRKYPEHTFTHRFLNQSRLGQIACALSHINIWRSLLESKYDSAIIFEDDMYVTDTVRFNQILGELKIEQKSDWVRIHLHKAFRDEITSSGNGNLLTKDPMPWGFAAYFVTRSGARKLLEHCHDMDAPIDCLPPLLMQRKVLETSTVTEVVVEHHEFIGDAKQLSGRHKIETESQTLQKSPSTIWTSPPVRIIPKLHQFFLDVGDKYRNQKKYISESVSTNMVQSQKDINNSPNIEKNMKNISWTSKPLAEKSNERNTNQYFTSENTAELKNGGITVLRSVFTENLVEVARKKVLDYRHLLKNTRTTPSSGHLAGFHRFPALEPLHTMLSCNPIITTFLEAMVNRSGIRSIGLSDITINRSQQWHNDLLRGKYQQYLDGILNWEIDGGGVYKVLLYLQESSSLKYIKGSHLKPVSLDDDLHTEPTDGQDVTSIGVNPGDVVIMDIRCSHRGTDEAFYAEGKYDQNPRILISTVLGGINHKLTNAMEIGNFHRLQDWMQKYR